jgi:hypothetical protein
MLELVFLSMRLSGSSRMVASEKVDASGKEHARSRDCRRLRQRFHMSIPELLLTLIHV